MCRLVLVTLVLAAPPALAQPAGTKYALLVGVDRYDPKELTNLRFAVRDVTALAAALQKSGYRAEDVVLMTPRRGAEVEHRFTPTSEHVADQLSLLLARARPEDSVIVAFAGHGIQFRGESEVFFCPTGTRLGDRTTLLSLAEVYRQLERCQAAVKLLLSDACRDDPLAAAARSSATVQVERGRKRVSAPPRGVVAFFSCSEGQQAFESDKLQHGVFFHHVIEGFKGRADRNRDGRVTLNELDDYVQDEVYRFVRAEFGAAQLPNRVGSTSGLLPLAVVDPRSLPPPAVAKVAPKSANPVFVPEPPRNGTVRPDPVPKAAKGPEARPVDTRNGYKLYIEASGELTCYLPNGVHGFDKPYWSFKPPEGAVTRALFATADARLRVAVVFGKKAALLDGRLGSPVGLWPRDVTGAGAVTGLSFDASGKVLVVGGSGGSLRFDAETGDTLNANGTRVFK